MIELALQAQIDELKNVCLSQKQVYLPPWKRKSPPSETRRHNGDFEDDQDNTPRGQPLSHADIHQIYQNFQVASHGEQKLNLSEFSGESNGDVFMDWLLQVKSVLEYKKYIDPQ